ncbi:hypothetical protein PPERSA_10571 [Pseudocohnilembus persalinus]|uniref:NAC-A/B domain-containing protein n=1 Tax=Pseudocohnilembus persalinus TaxID=266149 RepID=A0A0V0Q985_PSEPJ|nr:hypothetical protein PPERSA_10571 [Pseudocohnilembus persalinus]|eukprot:KRW98800.1 hypothetical protein PPERSA_10571 [Pseudocohnilembus persalinus]
MADKNEVELKEEKVETTQQQQHDSDDEAVATDGKKINRGEKKFKKAMGKLGLKAISGINRVTIKKGKQLQLYIDEPEIMVSPASENTYIIFGEAKINDFAAQMAQQEARNFQKPEQATQQAAKQETVVEKKEAETDDLNEEGLDQEAIKMVMEHSKVTKAEAIKALRASGGDQVNAILKLSDQ